jgi:zinc/manganese transport system ATP-binding protein
VTTISGVHPAPPRDVPALEIEGGAFAVGGRELWHDLDLRIEPGEFVAVLGANGSGKTSLLRTVLGQQSLTAGRMRVLGHDARRGGRDIGYVPQQKLMDRGTPVRARDLISFGLGGHRWGLPIARRDERRRVDEVLEQVGATALANLPFAALSGGEQQRVRVGQAIAGEPKLLLCDEPLLSLDLQRQREVCELIDAQRRRLGTAVLFVTHDVNPLLDLVDRVLYLAGGHFRIGTPDEVLRTEVLSELYGTRVDVVRAGGRVIVVQSPGADHHHPEHETEGGA